MSTLWRKLDAALIALTLALSPTLAQAEPVDYLKQIKPLLAARCAKCHGPDKQEAGLRLDAAKLALTGGDSGPAIKPGEAKASRLIDALTGANDATRMPPEGEAEPLSADEVALVAAWINEGAQSPNDEPIAPEARRRSDHWAFQPIARPAPPVLKNPAWARNLLDAFILAELEAHNIAPSPEADRTTLIRRASLDLVGLLPSIEEVDAFVADTRSGAYERVVERLLASPHYGEHWGRHWLDAARYADSNGYTIDGSRSIWKYRDWVIAALNGDMPFDEFTIEQIAGDMLPGATLEQRIATGFHRNTLRNEEGGTDQEQFRIEAVADRVETTGSVFLGLTVACARCHDHKFDPISQREYYRLFAVFNNADEPSLPVPSTQQAKELPALESEIAQTNKRLDDSLAAAEGRQVEWEKMLLAPATDTTAKPAGEQISEAVLALVKIPRDERTKEQRKQLKAEYRKLDQDLVPLDAKLKELRDRQKQLKKAITTTLVVVERDQPRETHLHIRGDFLRHGALVAPGAPAVLPPLASTTAAPTRLDFARWLVDRSNPLTARVTVNRIWQSYFGQGLVVTENDFGVQGTPPTHPALLDALATELMDRRWSLKSLHRLIVTSATYRQSSQARPELWEVDPTGKLLARQTRLRLEAETVRDAGLAASGLLTREIGGPSVYPPQPEGVYRFTQLVKYWGESQGADRYRRGMYTFFWRASPYPFLTTFDAPDANVACTRRARSNTPLQALTLANDRAQLESAQGLAARVLREAPASDSDRVERAFRLCLARRPTELETQRLAQYLQLQRESFAKATPEDAERVAPKDLPERIGAVDGAAWTSLARVLLNLDEFITRE